MHHYKTMLTIAGSDSIGGAGIQADIKAATSLGVYTMTAITAVTAQNSMGVRAVEPVSVSMLEMQLQAVFEDALPDAMKVGMIPSLEHVRVIVESLRRNGAANIVVDPVLKSTSGTVLSPSELVATLGEELFPLATLITPNVPEAETLLGRSILTYEEQLQAAEELRSKYGCRGVLLKGGHLEEGDEKVDVLAEGSGMHSYRHERIVTRNSHGTGCTLSSAIASFLALGWPLEEAVEKGIGYLCRALEEGTGYYFGQENGYGPVNFLYSVSSGRGRPSAD